MIEYEDLLGDPGDTLRLPGQLTKGWKQKAELDPQAMEFLQRATKEMAKGWKDFIEHADTHSLSPHLTPGVAAYRFVLAKYFGKPYSRYLSLCFTPEQVTTAQGNNDTGTSLYDFICKVADGDEACAKSLIWNWKHRDLADMDFLGFLIVGALGWHGSKMPLAFPASTAAELYDEFCREGGSVLDPCHGWGGDLMGYYLSANPVGYTGFDPSPIAHKGCTLLTETIEPYVRDKQVILRKECFEKAKLPPKRFDFAFTSPPYYDTEKYEGKEQSWKLYKTFDKWCEGFYLPLFKNTHAALKPQCFFALNVGQQRYPLVDKGIELAEKAGFTYMGWRKHVVKQNVYHSTSELKGESLILLQKK